jgi:hypothetical protein
VHPDESEARASVALPKIGRSHVRADFAPAAGTFLEEARQSAMAVAKFGVTHRGRSGHVEMSAAPGVAMTQTIAGALA